ncbi:MAG TPA: hypothetical protein VET90_08440 [Candidatus Binatus sp.]|nr:hypothetical protein [Candidatus Binatus sp.]
MTRVYVDVGAAILQGEGSRASLAPDAPRTLRILAESGHDVVLVTDIAGPPPADVVAVAADAVGTVPASPADQAWYLTADVEHCRGTSARLRTLFIGGNPPAGSIHRCDGIARDLLAAVMEILASEAMPTST